ncbi:hypothetical protein SH528x_003856 [Novipirellula sp. SH528]|uniref:hypothetical protein n=1 Tax=Novipirellula sp. SH528 TaxID=3454466 RepID=UPI003FA132DB
MGNKESQIWAVTCFFNPMGSRLRRENYLRFRRQLDLPLLTIELSYRDAYELTDNDADMIIRVSGGDILDQKERLLNLSLDALPASCEYVAWLDCDLIFLENRWPEETVRALESSMLVQLFSVIYYLPKPTASACDPVDRNLFFRRGLAALVESGLSFSIAYNQEAFVRALGSASPGHAWAMRRDVLQRHRLYDRCPVGGADSAINCAAYGDFDLVIRNHRMNRKQELHYLEWARPFHKEVKGRVASVTGEVLHLWHGSIADRHTEDNYTMIEKHEFDPYTDLAETEEGSWAWATDKPGLHNAVRQCFERRNEDGEAAN